MLTVDVFKKSVNSLNINLNSFLVVFYNENNTLNVCFLILIVLNYL